MSSMDTYRDKILGNCPVDVVAAISTVMMPYPKRIGHVTESSPTISDNSSHYILDSNISSGDVTATDVLDRGEHLNADWVVPCDVIDDPQTTTERIREMFVQREQYEYTPEILVPLQSNDSMSHTDHYRDVMGMLSNSGFETDNPIAVGGVKDMSPNQQIERAMNVRRVMDGQYLHVLGVGCSTDWIATIREFPELVDGVDMSSPAKSIISGNNLVTSELEYVNYPQPRGKNSTVLVSSLIEYVLYMMNYLMGPDIRESDAPSVDDVSDRTAELLEAWERFG